MHKLIQSTDSEAAYNDDVDDIIIATVSNFGERSL
jgi:hypothetical protein